jgi:hypothetical protein
MDPDLALVVGLVICLLSIPSILSALSDRRAPRASLVTVLLGGGMVLYAMQSSPGGYAIDQVPDVFARVLARYMP